jgi:hypothetical protein
MPSLNFDPAKQFLNDAAIDQCCQRACFHTKSACFGIFWKALESKNWCMYLHNVMPIWYFIAILLYSLPFGILWAGWYILFSFLVCCTKKNLATLLLTATKLKPFSAAVSV